MPADPQAPPGPAPTAITETPPAAARVWPGVIHELLGLVAALAVLACMLWLIEHVGSNAP
jgi:hypothetical protein